MYEPVCTTDMQRAYESDITRFLRKLKQNDPDIERGQHKGRAIFWDKNLDADMRRRHTESTVPQAAYVYGTSVHQPKAK